MAIPLTLLSMIWAADVRMATIHRWIRATGVRSNTANAEYTIMYAQGTTTMLARRK